MNKYLKNSYTDIGSLKKDYKELAFKLHPDVSGLSGEEMKILNAEYEAMCKKTPKKAAFDREKAKPEAERSYQRYEYYAYDPTYVDLINKLIQLRMQNVTCTICGFFVYLEGMETKNHKDKLKEIGFKWNSTKRLYYWCPEWYRKNGGNQWSFEKIKETFGNSNVDVNDRTLRLN